MAQNIDVSIIPQSYLPEIKVSENDDSLRVIRVSIIDENGEAYQIPSGVTATFAGTKPSGLGFTVPCTIDGSAVQFVMEDTVCNEAGRFPAEIRLINGEDRIGTCNVLMSVEPNPHPDDTTDGDREPLVNEITALLQQITEQAEQVAEDAQAVQNAVTLWTNMTAEAETLPAGSEASASYSDGVLSLGIPTGPEGTPGQDGQDGVGIANVQLNSDYTLTITLTDGRTYTTTSIRGEQGETGLTPDFTIGTVTTLAPGSQATATITGTDEEPVLNLGIPKGDPGDASSTGYYPDLYAGGLVTDKGETDTAPYTFRASKALGYRESLNQIVGATVGWNQLVASGATSVTVQSGHKYYSKINNVKTIGESDGTAIAINDSTKDNVIDLTSALGTAIANKAYTLETATPGSGIAWLRSYGFLTEDYYEYCQPRLESVRVSGHETTGFNQLPQELTYRETTTALDKSKATRVISGRQYQLTFDSIGTATNWRIAFKVWDNNGNIISDASCFTTISGMGNPYWNSSTNVFIEGSNDSVKDRKITFNVDGYVRFYFSSGNTASGMESVNACFHFDGDRNGEYEPYTKHTYPLDSTLTLNGILKLSGDEIYADGDVYPPSGNVSRRYNIVDLGTLNWINHSSGIFWALVNDKKISFDNVFCAKYTTATNPGAGNLGDKQIVGENSGKAVYIHDTNYTTDPAVFKASLDGVYMVYEVTTPTTETADPYTQIQICDPDGTEAFTDYGVASGDRDVAIPVGHSTFYPEDLKGKLEDIPDIPEAPANNGTYTLKAVRSNSGVTYSWVSG